MPDVAHISHIACVNVPADLSFDIDLLQCISLPAINSRDILKGRDRHFIVSNDVTDVIL